MIPVRQETIDVVKKLTKLEFNRDAITGQLTIESQYTTGYEDAEVGFVTISTGLNNFSDFHSAWILARKGSEGGLTDPTLADFLITLFDGLEKGDFVLPDEPVA